MVLRHGDAKRITPRTKPRVRFRDAYPTTALVSLVAAAAPVACAVTSSGRDCSDGGGSGSGGSGVSGVIGGDGGRGGGDSSGRPGIVSQKSKFDTLM